MINPTIKDLLKQQQKQLMKPRVSTLCQPLSSVIMDTLTTFYPEFATEDNKPKDIKNLRTVFGNLYEECVAEAFPTWIPQVELELNNITGTADFIDYQNGVVIETKCVAPGVADKIKGQPRKGVDPNPDYLGYVSQLQAYMIMANMPKGQLRVVNRGYLTVSEFDYEVNLGRWETFTHKADIMRQVIQSVSNNDLQTCLGFAAKAYQFNQWHPYSVYRSYGHIFTKGSYGAVVGVDDNQFKLWVDTFVTTFFATENKESFYVR